MRYSGPKVGISVLDNFYKYSVYFSTFSMLLCLVNRFSEIFKYGIVAISEIILFIAFTMLSLSSMKIVKKLFYSILTLAIQIILTMCIYSSTQIIQNGDNKAALFGYLLFGTIFITVMGMFRTIFFNE